MSRFNFFDSIGDGLSNAWEGIKSVAGMADPAKGYNTAAKGAEQASEEYRKLAEVQWQRQMEGLMRAQQSMGGYQQLYDRIYGLNQPQRPPMQMPLTQAQPLQRPPMQQPDSPLMQLLNSNRMR